MTNYRTLATEALTAEGIHAYFGDTDTDGLDPVGALAQAMEELGVETADNDSWTAPEGLAEQAQRILAAQ